jgi:hypothetical protein
MAGLSELAIVESLIKNKDVPFIRLQQRRNEQYV